MESSTLDGLGEPVMQSTKVDECTLGQAGGAVIRQDGDEVRLLDVTSPSSFRPVAMLVAEPNEGGLATLAKLGLKEPDTATAVTSEGREIRFYRARTSQAVNSRKLGPGLWLVEKYVVPADGLRWVASPDSVKILPLSLQNATEEQEEISAEDPYSFGPIKRVRVRAEAATPPAMMVPGLLYEEGVHHWAAWPGTGKSIAAMAVAAMLMRDGKRVMYVDVENGEPTVGDRMAAMGLTDAELDELFCYYPFPKLDPQKFLRLVQAVDPALVVFDNLAGLLADAGIDENSNTGVTHWYNSFPKPIKADGKAVLILDHVTKKGGTLRGAGSKLAELETQSIVRQTKEFNRHKVGELRFTLEKDRPAAMPDKVVAYRAGGTPFVFQPIRALTDRQREAFEALEDGATSAEWMKASGLAKATFYRIRKELLEADLVIEDDKKRYYVAG